MWSAASAVGLFTQLVQELHGFDEQVFSGLAQPVARSVVSVSLGDFEGRCYLGVSGRYGVQVVPFAGALHRPVRLMGDPIV